MPEVSKLLERGHLVADRRGRNAEVRAFRDGLAADRLAAAHVLLHHGTQDGGLARSELGRVWPLPIFCTPTDRLLTAPIGVSLVQVNPWDACGVMSTEQAGGPLDEATIREFLGNDYPRLVAGVAMGARGRPGAGGGVPA